jgi:hypothetical protein
VPRTRQFVDRPAERAELESVLLPRPGHGQRLRRKTYVLRGLGGTGKTQLAVEFVRRHDHQFRSVLWLDGRSEDSPKRSIASCAGRIPKGQILETCRSYASASSADVDAVMEDAMTWLARPDNTAWLLILDHVNRELERRRRPGGCAHEYDAVRRQLD